MNSECTVNRTDCLRNKGVVILIEVTKQKSYNDEIIFTSFAGNLVASFIIADFLLNLEKNGSGELQFSDGVTQAKTSFSWHSPSFVNDKNLKEDPMQSKSN